MCMKIYIYGVPWEDLQLDELNTIKADDDGDV